jgi:two-component sensor histidine kinase
VPARLTAVPPPPDVLITQLLRNRPARDPDLAQEVRAFHELSTLIMRSPDQAVQHFLNLALELCQAGSAGVSLLEMHEDGTTQFRWIALAGEFASYVGGTTPRHHSPCGLCLDQGATILVSQPARAFEYFNTAHVPIIEGLIVPLYDTGRQPLGTLWIVSHEEGRSFDATDARVMEQLAAQLVLALKWQMETTEAEGKIAHLEAQARSFEQAAQHKDAIIAEVNHRVKNSIQSSMALLRLQAKTIPSPEAQEALSEAQARLAVFATVHELLYRNSSSAQAVAMADLLDALANASRTAFADRSGLVRLKVRSDAILLDPEQAVPLALIINEAVTNAYKHAHPNGKPGEIQVSLEREPRAASD